MVLINKWNQIRIEEVANLGVPTELRMVMAVGM